MYSFLYVHIATSNCLGLVVGLTGGGRWFAHSLCIGHLKSPDIWKPRYIRHHGYHEFVRCAKIRSPPATACRQDQNRPRLGAWTRMPRDPTPGLGEPRPSAISPQTAVSCQTPLTSDFLELFGNMTPAADIQPRPDAFCGFPPRTIYCNNNCVPSRSCQIPKCPLLRSERPSATCWG